MSEPIIGVSAEATYQCPDCKGTGKREATDHVSFWEIPCHRCGGTGKLDWVSYIIRKMYPHIGVSC
jgi:DnaJ-class molecular chaperone